MLNRILRPIGAAVASVTGIDVSHFQQDIDWKAVASAGARFCFIKATEGAQSVDERFTANWHGSAEAGLMRGAYHFFHPVVPVSAQVDLFVRTVEKLQENDLPPALDLEAPAEWTGIPQANRVALVLQWLEGVENRLGVRPLVYLCPAFANEVLQNAPALARFPLWIAHKTLAAAPMVPKPWKSWVFWQYSDQVKMPGIATAVDGNRFNGTTDTLRALPSSTRAAVLAGGKS